MRTLNQKTHNTGTQRLSPRSAWSLVGSVALIGLLASPAQADDLVRCGGEGESPCGVTERDFWQNGTGFCDSGLKATGFRVLPDVPAFRGNDWVNTSETSVQPLREIVAAGKELGAAFGDIDTDDLWQWGVVDEVCFWGGACIPIYGPKLAGVFVSLLDEFGALLRSLGGLDDLLGPIFTHESFAVTPHLPTGAPRFNFDPDDFLRPDQMDDFVVDYVNAVTTFCRELVRAVEAIVNDFDNPPGRCRNHIRRDWDADVHVRSDGRLERRANGALRRGNGVGDVTERQRGWSWWALLNQRNQLGEDEPINWIQHVDTHNAYNNAADGFLFPNQRYSITDQLNHGARSIELDPNFYAGRLRVCHAKDDDVGCSALDRLFDNVLKEIRNWLDANPSEVIFIRMEDYVKTSREQRLLVESLEARLGDLVYRVPARGTDLNTPARPWPSIRELRAAGKQVVIVAYFQPEISDMLHANPVVESSGSSFFTEDNQQHICAQVFRLESNPDLAYETTSDGDRIWVDGDGAEVKFDDRPFAGFHEIIRITESRPLLETAMTEPDREIILLNEIEVAYLAQQCRTTITSMDFMHGKEETPLDTCEAADLSRSECRTPDRRMTSMIWSWASGDMGQHGDGVALNTTTGRWSSVAVEVQLKAACARPRGSREGSASTWVDPDGAEWKITTGVGAWTDAGQLCFEEFGADWVFGVPVHGWQNARLHELTTAGEKIWINYNDIERERYHSVNTRPVARATVAGGADVILKEGSPIDFDALQSTDRERHSLSHTWDFADGTAGVQGVEVVHAYGDNNTYAVELNTDDGFSGVDVEVVEIEVVNVPPTASIDVLMDETGAVIGEDVPVALIGLQIDLQGSFTDPGWLDTHTAAMAWGDGLSDPAFDVVDTVATQHIYAQPGSFTMTMTVLDDDGGLDQPERTVRVVDAAGALEIVDETLAGNDGAETARFWLARTIDQFQRDNSNATLEMFTKLIQAVVALELSTGRDLHFTRGLIALAAKSVMISTLEAASSSRHPRLASMLNAAMSLIEDGDSALASRDHVRAIELYQLANREVQGLR